MAGKNGKAKPKGQPQEPKPIKTEPVDTFDTTLLPITQDPSSMDVLNVKIPYWLMDIVEEVGETLGKTKTEMVVEALRFHLDLYVPEGMAAREKAYGEETESG